MSSTNNNLPQTPPDEESSSANNNNGDSPTTAKLVLTIRESAVDLAVEAVRLARFIETWAGGEIESLEFLEELNRQKGNELWAAIAHFANLDLPATYRFLEATALERIEQGRAAIDEAERLIDQAQGGEG